ncbi:MAG: dephospho-CoA kinase [Lachnospiraceae bacterium]|nr:dephospho-CoA kinase [Lachnospiraceae bacterium]
MIVIGITGGVGSGKSTVIEYLTRLAPCRVIYADTAAKDLYQPGGPCYEELLEILRKAAGDKADCVCREDGSVDTGFMSRLIFSDEELLKEVNGLIHPAVFRYIMDEIEKARSDGRTGIFIVEAALLIECGYMPYLDSLWYVRCDEAVRRQRLKNDRGYSDEKIDSIMKSQLKEEEFLAACDICIDNSGGPDRTRAQIREALYELQRDRGPENHAL